MTHRRRVGTIAGFGLTENALFEDPRCKTSDLSRLKPDVGLQNDNATEGSFCVGLQERKGHFRKPTIQAEVPIFRIRAPFDRGLASGLFQPLAGRRRFPPTARFSGWVVGVWEWHKARIFELCEDRPMVRRCAEIEAF